MKIYRNDIKKINNNSDNFTKLTRNHGISLITFAISRKCVRY